MQNDRPANIRRAIVKAIGDKANQGRVMRNRLAQMVVESYMNAHGTTFAEFRLKKSEFFEFLNIVNMLVGRR